MSIIDKLLKPKEPSISRNDITDIDKVAEYVIWFIKNDQFVKDIQIKCLNDLYNEGYRPNAGTSNNPESVNNEIQNFTEWFFLKIYLDFLLINDFDQDQYSTFLDMLNYKAKETLKYIGENIIKYNLDANNFNDPSEFEKIPDEYLRTTVKQKYLEDTSLGAEIRILTHFFNSHFESEYQIQDFKE